MDQLNRYQPLYSGPGILRILSALLVFLSLGINNLIGQEDQKEKSFQQIFDDFKNSNDQEFDQFRKRNDSVFNVFLKKAWIEYEVFVDQKPRTPKPAEQPSNTEKTVEPVEIVPKKNSVLKINDRRTDPEKGSELNRQPKDGKYNTGSGSRFTTSFYGWPVRVPGSEIAGNPELNLVNEGAISEFHRLISQSAGFQATVNSISDFSSEKQLNGWSQLQFIQTVASNRFRNSNSMVLFTWMALIHTGFLARVCYSNNEVFLMVPFNVKTYLPYIEADEGDLNYYLILFPGQEFSEGKVKSYEKYQHPAPLQELSLYVKTLPQLGNSKINKILIWNKDIIPLVISKNLIDFYASYPDCDLTVPGNTPLSAGLLKSLDTYFLPKFAGKSDIEKVNTLLGFIQFAIQYQTDEQQFGRENYLFPEETLFYPFADCEDRVSLMVQLVNRYTGLPSIGLSYPGHVSMAVAFKISPGGANVSVSGKIYWVCDPTFLGSTGGMVMPAFRNVNPEIIEL